MGDNVKYLAAVKSRFWREKKQSPGAQTDGFISMTWEATDNQKDEGDAVLTSFSGGPAAAKSLAIPSGGRDRVYGEALEKIYPGFTGNFEKSRYMNWVGDPWTLAGYSFPAPGQVTTIGPALAAGIDHLHFAGEHACYKFVGYMEGGLSSGAAVAKRLARRDGAERYRAH